MPNLQNERGWQLSTSQLKAVLGCPKDWPNEGIRSRLVENVWVYVLPKNPHNGKRHRAMAVCPVCEEAVSAGRLHQHMRGKHG